MGKISALKRIDLTKGYFDANGHRYHIYDSVSFGRYKEYVKFQHYFAFGALPADHIKFIDFAIQQLSGPLTGMTIHKVLENALNVKEAYSSFLDSEYDRYFEFCTLFINREDEDIATWSKTLAASKIDDWNEALYDPADFFFLAANMSAELRRKYSLLPREEGEDQDSEGSKKSSQASK